MATIMVSGTSGFLGAALCVDLRKAGHKVARLTRWPPREPDDVRWDPEAGHLDRDALSRVAPTVVVHLAGAPIAERWTTTHRRRIRDSRVRGTTTLAEAVAALDKKPMVFVSQSAIGYYGSQRGDDLLDESSTGGQDFLAEVARDWERAAAPAADAGIRVALCRTGIVIGNDGGMMQRVLPPFRAGVGGRLGDGRQWMSWISRTDWISAMLFLIDSASVSGPVNLVSPAPVRNDEFTNVLATVLRRPAVLPVPRLALQLMFGEMADHTIFASQRVAPKKLAGAGFEFQHPRLEEAFRFELMRSIGPGDR